MLPAYPWSQRPDDHPLTLDEVTAAIVEASGDVTAAADRLKVGSLTLRKFIERSPRARAVVLEMDHRLADRARKKLIAIINDDGDARRQDWAIRYVLNAKMARHLGFASMDSAEDLARQNNSLVQNNYFAGRAGWADGTMFRRSEAAQPKLIDLVAEPLAESSPSSSDRREK